MPSKSGVKGYTYEKLINDGFRAEGYDVSRPRAGQPHDIGDHIGIPDWTLQDKNHKNLSLPKAVEDAKQQAKNAGTKHWAVIHKRYRNNNFYDQLVTMDVRQLLELISGN